MFLADKEALEQELETLTVHELDRVESFTMALAARRDLTAREPAKRPPLLAPDPSVDLENHRL